MPNRFILQLVHRNQREDGTAYYLADDNHSKLETWIAKDRWDKQGLRAFESLEAAVAHAKTLVFNRGEKVFAEQWDVTSGGRLGENWKWVGETQIKPLPRR